MAEFVKVAFKNEISSGKGKSVEVKGKVIAILNHNGEFFAIDNDCVHMGGSLGEGSCQDGLVTCPLHGWEYELKTGKCTFNPGVTLNTYEVKVEGSNILVNLEPRKKE